MPTSVICQVCGARIPEASGKCPSCAQRRRKGHPGIQAFLDVSGQFSVYANYAQDQTRLVGKGGLHLPVMFLYPVLLGVGLHLLEKRYGLPIAALGALWGVSGYSQGIHKQFSADFSQTPPKWKSNDNAYWIEAREFILEGKLNPRPPRSGLAELMFSYGGKIIAIALLLPLVYGGYLYSKQPQGAKQLVASVSNLLKKPKPLNLSDASSQQLKRVGLLDEDGRSAMHHAASRGNPEEIRKLLADGEDPTAKDLKGNTPKDLASKNGKTEAAQLLQSIEDAGAGKSLAPSELANLLASGHGADLSLYYFAKPDTRVVLRSVLQGSEMLEETQTLLGPTPMERALTYRTPFAPDGRTSREALFRIAETSITRLSGSQTETVGPRYVRLYEALGQEGNIVALNVEVQVEPHKRASCLIVARKDPAQQQRTETQYCKGYGKTGVKTTDSQGKVLQEWTLTTRLAISKHDNPPIAQSPYLRVIGQAICNRLGGKNCFHTAVAIESEGRWQDARPFYAKNCEQGNASACLSLANLLTRTSEAELMSATFAAACRGDEPAGCTPQGSE